MHINNACSGHIHSFGGCYSNIQLRILSSLILDVTLNLDFIFLYESYVYISAYLLNKFPFSNLMR